MTQLQARESQTVGGGGGGPSPLEGGGGDMDSMPREEGLGAELLDLIEHPWRREVGGRLRRDSAWIAVSSGLFRASMKLSTPPRAGRRRRRPRRHHLVALPTTILAGARARRGWWCKCQLAHYRHSSKYGPRVPAVDFPIIQMRAVLRGNRSFKETTSRTRGRRPLRR